MEHWDEGVYAFRGNGGAGATPLILSAGIHGNEKAPARVLESLLAEFQNRSLTACRPCLIIMANIPALLNDQRFLHVNMNRLFGAPMRPPGYEGGRSLALEDYCRDFAELYGAGWHLDLHSTIKPSRHSHFALMPASEHRFDKTWSALLAQFGFTALVRQTSPSHTFSHFSCAQLGFESFTLECGAVGKTQSDAETVLQPLLRHLLNTDPFTVAGTAKLQHYDVVLDLIKHHHNFRFLVDEQGENFSTFDAGTPLAVDGDITLLTPGAETALLFANSQVPVGDRAGLLLQPTSE